MEGSAKTRPHVFERGDRLFLVAPVAPITLDDADIDHFAFAEDVKKSAPNPNFLWLRGNYVEADNPNANGDAWTAGELQIKSLTPMYCPVTVMHDPRTAVGLIADTALKTPDKDSVPRSRIETTLAIWAHRFPSVAEEIAHNYEQGTLMQSMECQAPNYACMTCGQTFHKLPDGAERDQWCEHLAENPNAGRILGGVTFTGTGLIFGSRGAEGAYSEAHLEQAVRNEIVAAHDELHERTTQEKTDPKPSRSVIPMEKREIALSEYDELRGRPTQDELTAEKKRADEASEKLAESERAVEEAEAAQKKAEKERDEEKGKREKLEEEARSGELSTERLGKLGNDFTEALGEKTRERLTEQAGKLEDEEWEARLTELEDLTETKRDAGAGEEGAPGGSGGSGSGGTVSREETASTRVGGGGNGGSGEQPSDASRKSVMSGLIGGPSKKSD